MFYFIIVVFLVAENVHSAEATSLCSFARKFPCSERCCPVPVNHTGYTESGESPPRIPTTNQSSTVHSNHEQFNSRQDTLNASTTNRPVQSTEAVSQVSMNYTTNGQGSKNRATTVHPISTTPPSSPNMLFTNDTTEQGFTESGESPPRIPTTSQSTTVHSNHEQFSSKQDTLNASTTNRPVQSTEAVSQVSMNYTTTGQGSDNRATTEHPISTTPPSSPNMLFTNDATEQGGGDSTLKDSSASTTFTDCNDVYNAGNTQDGVYPIRPTGWNGSPFVVFCNMSIDGGSWTVIQRRVDGSTDFYQNWTSYKEGFGNLKHEFWLGNEKIYHLTNQSSYEYRFDYLHGSGWYYHKYDRFRIDDETNKYKITEVGLRTGTNGYTLGYTRNIEFSTYDQDNDGWGRYDCAEGHRGGWWYGGVHFETSVGVCYEFKSGNQSVRCSHSNINGDYRGGHGQKLFQKGHTCYAIYTEIKVRRIL